MKLVWQGSHQFLYQWYMLCVLTQGVRPSGVGSLTTLNSTASPHISVRELQPVRVGRDFRDPPRDLLPYSFHFGEEETDLEREWEFFKKWDQNPVLQKWNLCLSMCCLSLAPQRGVRACVDRTKHFLIPGVVTKYNGCC